MIYGGLGLAHTAILDAPNIDCREFLRVLLLRADSRSANLGVRVLAEGTAALVRQAWGPSTTVHLQNFDGGDTGQSFNKAAIAKDVFRKNGPIKSTLRKYDVVIDVCGGDSFTDSYGLKRLGLILYTQSASQKLRIPTMLSPQTIGPFTNRVARALASRSLKRMTMVLSRDKASEQYSASLGRPVDLSATDVVFALPAPTTPKTRDIVLNVSGLLWNENSHVDSTVYRASVHSLIAALQERGHPITFMPHVLDNPRSDNDVPIAVELAHQYETTTDLAVPTSLQDARSIVSSARLVIGSRMHACLNAISTGTPAIPWAYSRKFAPLLEDIGWDEVVDLRTDPDPVKITLDILDKHSIADLTARNVTVVERAQARLTEVLAALQMSGAERTR